MIVLDENNNVKIVIGASGGPTALTALLAVLFFVNLLSSKLLLWFY
jgi:hypothetical protein